MNWGGRGSGTVSSSPSITNGGVKGGGSFKNKFGEKWLKSLTGGGVLRRKGGKIEGKPIGKFKRTQNSVVFGPRRKRMGGKSIASNQLFLPIKSRS